MAFSAFIPNCVLVKAVKPRTGVFCFLLHEARQASELEMPDADNVFMIKVCYSNSFRVNMCFTYISSKTSNNDYCSNLLII